MSRFDYTMSIHRFFFYLGFTQNKVHDSLSVELLIEFDVCKRGGKMSYVCMYRGNNFSGLCSIK